MTTETYDWDAIVSGLDQYLRLRSIPIGMKLFETVEEMEAIPKIRRPRSAPAAPCRSRATATASCSRSRP